MTYTVLYSKYNSQENVTIYCSRNGLIFLQNYIWVFFLNYILLSAKTASIQKNNIQLTVVSHKFVVIYIIFKICYVLYNISYFISYRFPTLNLISVNNTNIIMYLIQISSAACFKSYNKIKVRFFSWMHYAFCTHDEVNE